MRILTILTISLLAVTAQAQQLATSFRSIDVAPGVAMLVGEGGFSANMAVLAGKDRVALVDDGLEQTAPVLFQHIADTLGRPVDFVINTHVHGDHAGGNTHFAVGGTVVFAHENIRQRLLADARDAGGPGGLPVVTFGDGVTFHLGGLEARAFHVPTAHTDGDAAIHIPALNVIVAGDFLFRDMYPFIDLDNGGSVDGYIAAQEKLLSMANEATKIVPGHGELTDAAGLAADLAMLKDANSRVAALFAEGKSVDEVVELNPLAEYHAQYNWGFITTERMTRTLYRGLSTRGD